MSLAIFVSEHGDGLAARRRGCTMASCAASASNLFGAVMKARPVESARCSATMRWSKPAGGVEAGADGGAADGELAQAGAVWLSTCRVACRSCWRVAAEFLAERERGRVHEMGAADLDDLARTRRFRLPALGQRRQRWEQARCSWLATAAMYIAVGKVSLDDWDRLTWSLGWTGSLTPSVTAEHLDGAVRRSPR